MHLTDLYSADDPKDFEENPLFFGQYSEFFLESFPQAFPDAYAEDLFSFFMPILHQYRHCRHSCERSPRNEEILSAMQNKGTPGSHTFVRENGWRFYARPLMSWMFKSNKRFYYTSGHRAALLYLDIDAHQEYQSKEEALGAKKIIRDELAKHFGVFPPFIASSRGQNGYLAIDLNWGRVKPEYANRVFDGFQEAIRLLLAKNGNLCDFEIKGTITYVDNDFQLRGGRYGKLPMSSTDFSYQWFVNEFKPAIRKLVSLEILNTFIVKVRGEVSETELQRNQQARREAFLIQYIPLTKEMSVLLNETPLSVNFDFGLETYQGKSWIAKSKWKDFLKEQHEKGLSIKDISSNNVSLNSVYDNSEEKKVKEKDKIDRSFIKAKDLVSNEGPGFSLNNNENHLTIIKKKEKEELKPIKDIHLEELIKEPDSFKRQRKALLRYARCLKRVPNLTEALNFIKTNNLFSGRWQENLEKRKIRVKSILSFIVKTFDAAKCSKGQVNLGKYDQWTKNRFPHGFYGGKRRYLNEEGGIVEVKQQIWVSHGFVAIFMAISEFALLLEKNQDETLPHRRAKEIWSALYEKRQVSERFCSRKWAVCREEMVRYGIIRITNRDYYPGKAMEWAVAPYFPGLGLWRSKRKPSLMMPVSYQEFIQRKEKKQHNTLLRKQPVKKPFGPFFPHPRPPPSCPSPKVFTKKVNKRF